MYREKLNKLFEMVSRSNHKEEIMETITANLKTLVRYQNHIIEGVILSQARANGIEIANADIEKNNRERIMLHDKAIDAMVNVNTQAKVLGISPIFDINPNPAKDTMYKYDQNDHVKAAYMVADFINEYYNLGIQFERYDRAIDATTYNKIHISEKEWFEATSFSLPEREYDEEKINNIAEIIKNRISRENLSIEALTEMIKETKEDIFIKLGNDVKLTISPTQDGLTHDVMLETKTEETYGILTEETSPGFVKDENDPRKQRALELFRNQITAVIKDNGGISHESIKENGLVK